MFSCPARRVLTSCTSASNVPTLTTSRRLISTATATSLRPTRRYSSSSSSNSKPFGNRGLVATRQGFRKRDRQDANAAPANGTQPTATATSLPVKVEVEVEVVKSKKDVEVKVNMIDVKEESQAKRKEEQQRSERAQLPYVARTDHLHYTDVAISSFFALHRPVSVTFPVPGSYTTSSFSKIFDEPSSLSTIERYATQLEIQARQNPSGSNTAEEAYGSRAQEEDTDALSYGHRAAQTAPASIKEAIAASPIQLPGHILVKDYMPFTPPPVPTPASEAASSSDKPESTVKFTKLQPIGEKVKVNDETFTTYFFAQVPEVPTAENTRQRMFPDEVYEWRRQIRERVKGNTMYALSVKRQRKLKMKKHKYKKLMKRTRTERRRLDKQ